jgi:hypothetical protein
MQEGETEGVLQFKAGVKNKREMLKSFASERKRFCARSLFARREHAPNNYCAWTARAPQRMRENVSSAQHLWTTLPPSFL